MSQPVCAATTKRGGACRSFALPGRETCLAHTAELRPQVEAARRRGGTMAMKLRVLQGRRQKLDTPRALVKFIAALMEDTLAGAIDPKVANAIINAASLQRQLIEAADVDARLRSLEEQLELRGARRHA